MTNFYDFNITPHEEIIETLENFGFEGACIFYSSKDYLKKELKNEFNEIKNSTKLKLYHGVYIDEKNPELLRKDVQRHYGKVDLIMANGGDTKINRIISESPKIDIINKPYDNKKGNGINHVLAKFLLDNNITVNINLRDILEHRGFFRAKILSQINEILMLQRKYPFRTIISSGSKSFYDVKSPKSMILLNQIMDMDMTQAKNNISTNPEEIIKNITLKKESIIEGVRIINDKKEYSL